MSDIFTLLESDAAVNAIDLFMASIELDVVEIFLESGAAESVAMIAI